MITPSSSKPISREADQGDEDLKTALFAGFAANYSTKTEARLALGVRNIIDDTNVYDALKLLGVVREAGGL